MSDQIVHDKPFDEYAEWPGIHQSLLKAGLPPRGTMAHIRDAMDTHRVETKWMQMGLLVHAGLFDPLRMMDQYVVEPDFRLHDDNTTDNGKPSTSAATTWCKARVAEFKDANDGKKIVPQTGYDAIRAMTRNLSRHNRVQRYLASGRPEVSIRCPDAANGLVLVGRIDWLNESERWFLDLKSTNDISNPGRFIAQSKTDFQLAFYRRMLRTITGYDYSARLILVQNTRPFHVDAGAVHDEALDAMDPLTDQLLSDYARCVETGEWPGLDDSGDKTFTVGTWHLPEEKPLVLTKGGAPIAENADDDDGEIIMF